MNFEVVIGIEIHCELKTKTKMFSGSKVGFDDAPNTNVNEIDLGMPGTLPSLNKRAVEQALKACHIFHMDIDQVLRFDRKCYFYPDLTKGYQITQNDYPIGTNGYIEIDMDDYKKRIGIDRVVIEEDTAKLTHFDDYTLIDYNRCGTPLIEIISDASMRSAKEAAKYVNTLRTMLVYADISDAKMEEGSLRCDVNISLRPFGSEKYGVKTEIKNLNSVSNIEKAIDFEIKRQSKIILSNEKMDSETRRFDENSKQTILMRKKDGVIDYRFHSEPNIIPTLIADELVENSKKEIPLMPAELLEKYINDYQLNKVDANIIVNDQDLANYYNKACSYSNNYQQIANWLISEGLAYLNKNEINIKDMILKPEALAHMIELNIDGVISSKQLKQIFNIVNEENNNDIDSIIKKHNMMMISDKESILKFINQVMDNNMQSVEDYRNGNDRAIKHLLGQIMKISHGQVNPKLTNQLLIKELNKK
ncbi:MAG: Asp-tRNA(Asn)/Glu-tRNA(Gln) amidotransferase subunit GatB [Bacilli bacterium]|jgi:aspartyl-tRNA(Asn)/glutamyl-tRNA(Gln) amidotransferase subunit B|nr:Asp-tRNA(Asn)/Glu-tRNA(Gln) amidotransferase subunit GatB [Bacilli bacterium]